VKGISEGQQEANPKGTEKRIVISLAERVPDEGILVTPLAQYNSTAHISIGTDELLGYIWGLAVVNGKPDILPVDQLLIPGCGMHKFAVSPPSQVNGVKKHRSPTFSAEMGSHSRTIGALGLPVWERFTRLRVGIIGCGRTGSLIATTMVRTGLKHLTLLDPDYVEEHHLGEMEGVSRSDIGCPKAEAIAEALKTDHAPYPDEIGVDNDEARLSAGILATLFHKVLVDVGTGVLDPSIISTSSPSMGADEAGGQTALPYTSYSSSMGADVRLLLPTDGCLLCFGNFADPEEAFNLSAHSPSSSQNTSNGRKWWLERKGALRTLKMFASSLAVQALLDLIAERISSSLWLQAQFNNGSIHLSQIRRNPSPTAKEAPCPLCLRAGLGFDGLNWG